jgi:hypothetical protein ELI_0492
MNRTSIFEEMNNGEKCILFSICGILLAVAFVALLCSNFSYTQFEKPHLYKDYTIVSDPKTMEVSAYVKIKEDMIGKVFVLYTSDAFVDAYIDGNSIYHYGDESNFCRSPWSIYQMIKVPETLSCIGKTLKIHIRTVYKNKFKESYDIYLASSGWWIITELKKEILDILANIFIFMLGIIVFIVYALESKNGINNVSNLCLGIACILTATCTSCELFLFQLLLPTGVCQYYIYYCSFMIIPVLLIVYFESINANKIKLKIELYMHLTVIIIATMLQISGISEFAENMVIYLIACIIELISIVIKLLISKEYMRSQYLTFGLLILAWCIIINYLVYISNTNDQTSLLLTKIGFIIYVTISIFDSFDNLMLTLLHDKLNRKKFNLAHTDSLTKLRNRYAFDDDIKTINIEYLSLVSIDLNNLKYYNNTYGHLQGDKLIIEVSNILKQSFSGSIYRTGGGEFTIIQAGDSAEAIEIGINNVKKLAFEYNKYNDNLIIEIACGYSAYTDGDTCYDDILKRANKIMYKHKDELRKHSKVKSAYTIDS